MEFLVVLAVGAVVVWWFLVRKEDKPTDESAAPYKVETPESTEKTETVAHGVGGLVVVDTVPVTEAPAPVVEAPVVEEAKPKKKKPASPRKKKAAQ